MLEHDARCAGLVLEADSGLAAGISEGPTEHVRVTRNVVREVHAATQLVDDVPERWLERRDAGCVQHIVAHAPLAATLR